MIYFNTEGSHLVVTVETGVKTYATINLRIDFGSILAAVAIERLLTKRLYDFVESARREEYEQGWKDARSHKAPKRTWFTSAIDATWEGMRRP